MDFTKNLAGRDEFLANRERHQDCYRHKAIASFRVSIPKSTGGPPGAIHARRPERAADLAAAKTDIREQPIIHVEVRVEVAMDPPTALQRRKLPPDEMRPAPRRGR